MPTLTDTLNNSVGQSISEICSFSIANDSNQNHCAHYVSHMMGYELEGATCKNFTWNDKQKDEKGATLRVDDVFAASPETGSHAKKPPCLTTYLIFVTLASNVQKVGNRLQMGNQPKKHIGIVVDGVVWHYSNTNNKVVSESVTSFKSKFSSAYTTAGTTVEFYYGKRL